MAFELYIVESANRMNQLLIRAELYTEQQTDAVREAAFIGCRTLEQLADDTDFRRTIERMASLRLDRFGSTTQEFKDILDDVNKFEHFLCVERDILMKGGLAVDLAEKLIEQCRSVVTLVRDRIRPSDEVIETVRTLRDQACNRSKVLNEESTNTQRAAEMEGQLWRITIGIGGAALIGLDAAIAATTAFASAGLTAAGAAVSSAFGGAILQNATTTTPKTHTAGGGA